MATEDSLYCFLGQQKISFLLPKMHQEYTYKGPIHRETYRGIYLHTKQHSHFTNHSH